MRSVAFLLFFTFCVFRKAAGHSFITAGNIKPRNVEFHHYCQHCANGVGVCGNDQGEWTATAEAANVNGAYTTAIHELKGGSSVEFKIETTAPHKGHFVLELCRPSGNLITENCFSYKLKRDPSDERYSPYLSQFPEITLIQDENCVYQGIFVKYLIPTDFGNCDHCILRWYWQSGNSCGSHPAMSTNVPAEVKNWSRGNCKIALTSASPCGQNCPTKSCGGEQFKNCMDIKITGNSGGGGGTPPTSAPATTKATTRAPVTQAPTLAPTLPPGEGEECHLSQHSKQQLLEAVEMMRALAA